MTDHASDPANFGPTDAAHAGTSHRWNVVDVNTGDVLTTCESVDDAFSQASLISDSEVDSVPVRCGREGCWCQAYAVAVTTPADATPADRGCLIGPK